MTLHTNQYLCNSTNSPRKQILGRLHSSALRLADLGVISRGAHGDVDGDEPGPRQKLSHGVE